MVVLPLDIGCTVIILECSKLSEALELTRRGFISSALVINPIKCHDVSESL